MDSKVMKPSGILINISSSVFFQENRFAGQGHNFSPYSAIPRILGIEKWESGGKSGGRKSSGEIH